MSDNQNFYEIQLSTPHLVLAFLGATVVGVMVFWLGIVVGRGQTGPSGADEWQAVASAEDSAEEAYDFYEAVNEPTVQPQVPVESLESEAEQQDPANAPRFESADPVDEERAPVAIESFAESTETDSLLPNGWIVQVRSTPVKIDADSLQSALAESGLPVFVASAQVSGQTYYRVRVGPYRSKEEADIVEAKLLARSDVDTTWVTEG
ncbi:MAG TPA: SPOR domain-containing protein [Acidobacteriota bacterium]|jgi:cell division protein FtsN|nr:SPOR domain-containing protein [Acidobacteriota bacterium]|tara:strand:- start:2304 stop:2924 length:621 start_codon:yes stop_codon:yes gene_type:complete